MFDNGPPCLATILTADDPVLGDQRFEVLLNLAIYFRKMFGAEEILACLQAVNLPERFRPPLPLVELQRIAELIVKRPDQGYRCAQLPLANHCQRELCVTREFGVGVPPSVGGRGLRLGPLVKFSGDDVTWIWRINDTDVRLKTHEIIAQGWFVRRVGEALGVVVQPTSPINWTNIYSHAVIHATNVADVPDVTKHNVLWECFVRYSTEVRGEPEPFPRCW